MIYTGYYAQIKDYEQNGLIPVGISGKIPDGFKGIRYQQLAPKYSWWKQWHDEHMSDDWFTKKYYETVLNQLDPTQVLQDLQKFGKNVILLCYETPEKFCHRHIAAQWLNNKLNLEVNEYSRPKQPDLFNL
jgi:uncharacterized protein YeaO (DUF488 family)